MSRSSQLTKPCTRNVIYDYIYNTYCEWGDRDFHTFTLIIEKELGGITSDKIYDLYIKYAENDFDEFVLQIVFQVMIRGD
jgi:hypothetical protein|tara:strand:- start:791 stop:1030 length:240 start_codon:yes stop_codon:yes gene_type:complete